MRFLIFQEAPRVTRFLQLLIFQEAPRVTRLLWLLKVSAPVSTSSHRVPSVLAKAVLVLTTV
jgi:hypothetical protein